MKILTFGADDYQRFKAALCPSLSGIEVITTLEPKTEILARIGAVGDWLVDDKEVAIPAGMHFVRVMHGDGEESLVSSACGSLEQVMVRIRQTLDA